MSTSDSPDPTRPASDDLEGWDRVLRSNPTDDQAQKMLAAIVLAARQNGEFERLADALLCKIEHTDDPLRRRDSLVELSRLFEQELNDPQRALPVAVAALAADPSVPGIVDTAIRLALKCDDLDDLYRELASAAQRVSDPELGAELAVRLGRLYARQRTLFDYADNAFRQALLRVSGYEPALVGLIELCRRSERWAELAEWLEIRIPSLSDEAERASEWLALGDLYESQLAAPAKAEAAFDKAATSLELREEALTALSRLHRSREQWGKLVLVLERRAATGEPSQAAALYREAAVVRSEQMGDVPGAIALLEAAVERQPQDLSAWQLLVDLCDRSSAVDKYYAALEQLAQRAPNKDRIALLRRLAMELENEADAQERALDYYRQLIDLDRQSEEAYRATARILRGKGAGKASELEKILMAHAEIASGQTRATLWAEVAGLRGAAQDHEGSFFAFEQALLVADPQTEWLRGMAEVAERIGRWDRARDGWSRFAELTGDARAWTRAGDLSIEYLGQIAEAEVAYQQARALEPYSERACAGLAEVALRRHAWSDAVTCLIEAARNSDSFSLRAGYLTQAAVLSETELAQPDRAAELWLEVTELDPGQMRARSQVVQYLSKQGRWKELVPHITRLTENMPEHGIERARLEFAWGQAEEALGNREAAILHFHRASSADGTLNAAWLEWTRNLELASDWEQLLDAVGLALAQPGTTFSKVEEAELLARRARAGRAEGDCDQAVADFERALLLAPSPGLLAERLAALSELAEKRISSDPERAAALFATALAEDPQSLPILHKVLDFQTHTGRWQEATQTLVHIAELTSVAERKAKYLSAAATICRDELHDSRRAAALFGQAAALLPRDRGLLAATETLLLEAEAWTELATLYRSAIKTLDEGAPQAVQLELWTKLGDLCLDQLDQPEAATAAYEVVTSLNPDDLQRRELLAELYLEAGESRRADALDELHRLLERQPERIEMYRMLADLYKAEGNLDGAYATLQALAFLGVAEREDEEILASARVPGLRPGRSRLSLEQWQKSIPHRAEERRLVLGFSRIMPYLGAAVAQPISAFGIKSDLKIDVAADHRAPARVAQYAMDLLGMEPDQLSVYLDEEEPGGVRIANVGAAGRLTPALLIGLPHSLEQDERVLAFEIGRALAYLRPERFVFAAFHTLPALKSLVESVAGGAKSHRSKLARSPSSKELVGPKTAEYSTYSRILGEPTTHEMGPAAVLSSGSKWHGLIEKHLGTSGVAELHQLLDDDEPLLSRVSSWRDAADHTASRVGLLLCGDLEVAATALAQGSAALTTLPLRDRLRELVAFSVSEEYLELRRHVGLALDYAGAGGGLAISRAS